MNCSKLKRKLRRVEIVLEDIVYTREALKRPGPFGPNFEST